MPPGRGTGTQSTLHRKQAAHAGTAAPQCPVPAPLAAGHLNGRKGTGRQHPYPTAEETGRDVARPNWEYIRVDVLLRYHPKLDGLTAAAKWTLVGELWAHCGQFLTDGFVRDSVWRKTGTPAIRRQLVEHGLAEAVDGGWLMHDYLDHQRSRDEVEQLRRSRSEAGKRSGRVRAKARALDQAAVPASVRTPVEHHVEQTVQQNANKTRTEAEAEAEAEINPVAEVIHSKVEGEPGRIGLPTERWLADDEPEPLPPETLRLEAERRRQMDALMEWQRQHPELSPQ